MDEEYGISVEHAPDAKVLIISVAARLAGMHPQTLRQYDRLGLVQPGRAAGGGRRYSARDVALLREIQRLSQEDGVNLAGIKRIIEPGTARGRPPGAAGRARGRARRGVPADRPAGVAGRLPPPGPGADHRPSTALVVWRPRRSPEQEGQSSVAAAEQAGAGGSGAPGRPRTSRGSRRGRAGPAAPGCCAPRSHQLVALLLGLLHPS